MSQKAILVRIDGCLVEEVFSHVPDYNDMIQICIDNGYNGVCGHSDHYLVEYEWISIGEGESDTNEYIQDDTLLAIYNSYDYAKQIYEMFGHDVEVVESGSKEILFEDIAKELNVDDE